MRSDDVIADRYRLVERIGHGGMGIVWLADDLVADRRAVLRRPHGSGRADLERAVDIARRVAHPGVVEVYDVVGDGDDCWLVMEYFPSRALAAASPLPPEEVARIGAQVAATLAAAHVAAVVHRDITPDHVLVAEDGTAKVTGFGGPVGTGAYVSPEVADGAAVKAPSDLFSLGATLFDAVEGTPYGTGEPMTKAGPLAPVLDALLRRDRAARPTAGQAQEMLDQVVAGRPVPEWRPEPVVRRRPLLAVAALGVVALLVLALVRPWEAVGESPAHTVLGDPHTADPCALMSTGSLAEFGDATLNPHAGGFNRCDVVVAAVDVRVELRNGDAAVGEMVRGAAERGDDSCGVTITLADGNTVEVVAAGQTDANLCAIATAAADQAEAAMLGREEIPRRPEAEPGSLLDVDACMLVTAADLRTLPGFANAEPIAGFASWDCRWPNANGTAAARVVFGKGDIDRFTDGEHSTVSGRDVYLREEGAGDGTCQAAVVNRTYGDDLAEVARVVVEGDPAVPELCRMATTLAGPVASRLPR